MQKEIGNKEVKNIRKESAVSEGSGMFRVVITDEANKALEEIVAKVGVGFDAGTITKSDVANFVFQNITKYFSDADTKALRSLHFDDKKVLSTILKSDSDLPEELKKAIRQHYGVSEKEKKKPAKSLPDFSTANNVENT